MKNILPVGRQVFQFLLIVLFSILIFSCKEVGPVVDLSVPQTSKVVLLEEFTGVRCGPCPAAHAVVEELVNQYPDKLAVISIQTGGFSVPYPFSKDSFEIQEGIDIASVGLLGPVSVNPTGAVDRKIFDGQSDELVNKLSWSGFISQQLEETPKVNISIEKIYTDSIRKLWVNIKLQYSEAVGEPNYLSVVLTEDSIIDAQNDDRIPGIDYSYVHKHILRDMFTPYNGIEITEEKKAGAIIQKSFSLTGLPAKIKMEHCKIIAFVHESGGRLNVMQTAIVSVK